MLNEQKITKYTIGEEIMNSISHGIGVLLSIAALIIGVIWATNKGLTKDIVGMAVYGSMLILLYTMSTLYHALKSNNIKAVFRIFDHCSIFLLIAGTYMPIILNIFNGSKAATLLSITWSIATLGITLNIINLEKFEKISMVCYITMGWQVIFIVRPIIQSVNKMGITLFVIGGLFYTIGAGLYVIGKKKKYFHFVWHLFVLAGSIFHYFFILFYML